MNILVIAQYFPPDMGGGATRAYNAVKGLILNDCKVTVITAFPHYPHGKIPDKYRWKPFLVEYIEGMKIIRTFILPLESKGLARRLALFITFLLSSLFPLFLVNKIDAIFAANPNIVSFIPSYIYSKIKKAYIILNVDDLWPEELYNTGLLERSSLFAKIAEKLAQIAYRRADLITPISPGYIETICKKYGVTPRKIKVIRAGVDTSKFKYVPPPKKDKFTVLYIGAFSIAYDFDQILMAAKELKNHKDIEFILQGGGEQIDYVKQKVKELKLSNVKVIDKVVSRDKVAEILQKADVLLLPLKDFGKPYLGISSKLYEYQAVGRPILCCAIGQPATYIGKTKSGIVIKPGDYNSIAKAILYLKNNPEKALKMGKNGRIYVCRHVSIEAIGRLLVNSIYSITNRNIYQKMKMKNESR